MFTMHIFYRDNFLGYPFVTLVDRVHICIHTSEVNSWKVDRTVNIYYAVKAQDFDKKYFIDHSMIPFVLISHRQ